MRGKTLVYREMHGKKLKNEMPTERTDKLDALIKVLLDKDASIAERDDVAIDLRHFDLARDSTYSFIKERKPEWL